MLAFYIPVIKEYFKFECFFEQGFYSMCHLIFGLCVWIYLNTDLFMNMLGRWDDGGGVMAVKPETTVQDVSTLAIGKPLDVKTTIMNWMCKTSFV